jgi:hypothetical protein
VGIPGWGVGREGEFASGLFLPSLISLLSSLNLSSDLDLHLGLGFSTDILNHRQQNASSSKPPAST